MSSNEAEEILISWQGDVGGHWICPDTGVQNPHANLSPYVPSHVGAAIEKGPTQPRSLRPGLRKGWSCACCLISLHLHLFICKQGVPCHNDITLGDQYITAVRFLKVTEPRMYVHTQAGSDGDLKSGSPYCLLLQEAAAVCPPISPGGESCPEQSAVQERQTGEELGRDA